MKLTYYPDTDSLYIDLSEQPSVDSQEISVSFLLHLENIFGIKHLKRNSMNRLQIFITLKKILIRQL